MSTNHQALRITGVALFVGLAFGPAARASEIDDLKAEIRVMQQSIDQMQKKMSQLEDENQKQKQKTAASPSLHRHRRLNDWVHSQVERHVPFDRELWLRRVG